MPVKKSADRKKAADPKPVADPKSAAPVSAKPPSRGVWTLPIAMMMLVVGAGGLWIAVRESANSPQAASAADVVMKADAAASPAAKSTAAGAPAKASAPMTMPSDASKATDAPKSQDAVAATRPVSVTGCLQRNDRGFKLKDPEGTDAPKARSWKSGFFKRSSVSVTLREAGSAARLSDHVGQRVSVTGPMVDREMRVQSLRRVAATCQ